MQTLFFLLGLIVGVLICLFIAVLFSRYREKVETLVERYEQKVQAGGKAYIAGLSEEDQALRDRLTSDKEVKID